MPLLNPTKIGSSTELEQSMNIESISLMALEIINVRYPEITVHEFTPVTQEMEGQSSWTK